MTPSLLQTIETEQKAFERDVPTDLHCENAVNKAHALSFLRESTIRITKAAFEGTAVEGRKYPAIGLERSETSERELQQAAGYNAALTEKKKREDEYTGV